MEKQNKKSKILLATSTPNDYIKDIARRHGLEVNVNTGEKGLAGDWNYAYSIADTSLITIAHQDDVYLPAYSESIIRAFNESKNPLIAFSDYGELRNGKPVYKNKLLKIKRILLLPLRIKAFHKSIFVRRRVMSIGSAICCPAVSFYAPSFFGSASFILAR